MNFQTCGTCRGLSAKGATRHDCPDCHGTGTGCVAETATEEILLRRDWLEGVCKRTAGTPSEPCYRGELSGINECWRVDGTAPGMAGQVWRQVYGDLGRWYQDPQNPTPAERCFRQG